MLSSALRSVLVARPVAIRAFHVVVKRAVRAHPAAVASQADFSWRRNIAGHVPATRHMSGGPALSQHEKEEKILNILRCFDRIDAAKLTLDSNFIVDLGLDSLDVVECVMAVEEEFAIELSDDQAQQIRTPKDLLHYIH